MLLANVLSLGQTGWDLPVHFRTFNAFAQDVTRIISLGSYELKGPGQPGQGTSNSQLVILEIHTCFGDLSAVSDPVGSCSRSQSANSIHRDKGLLENATSIHVWTREI